MEEAAQILEVETLIPMLLQNSEITLGDNAEGGVCRLKRIVLIGDHYQLPPVVKHIAFQKHAHLDQSLFTRFIRLGVQSVLLDKQGRARPEIAALYNWRYASVGDKKGLGDLARVSQETSYKRGNSGFLNTFQLIDVPEFKGKGEFCPTPYFYQNLGEAEYIVAVFQYMRLLGYPAEKISIITTYNGQKDLIRDVINQRCKSPMFGRPATITTGKYFFFTIYYSVVTFFILIDLTIIFFSLGFFYVDLFFYFYFSVDKYQGQQNDYVLLSLVRTEAVGHLRDVRRLVVALSRARLGLYVFCRKALYANCYELSPAFNLMLQKSSELQLVGGESYPVTRDCDVLPDPSLVLSVKDVTAMGVLVYQMVQQSQHMNV